MTQKDDLSELSSLILSAIEIARNLKLPTSTYILSMALMEVMQERDAIDTRSKGDPPR
ncbi:hypothetical protein [uncultured Bradyrhizobium sp.]|uniref:hypothetical protein n=1 Tax=uncultured Bradyrhizobium sp. TaxID=199684 RepID=UPI0035CB5FC2